LSQIYKSSVSSPPPPTVATSYVANTGVAIPAANILNVVGSGGLTVTGSGNTLTLSPTIGSFLETLSDDVGTVVTPLNDNIQLVGHINEQGGSKFSTILAGTNLLNINPMTTARWIVDPLGFNGTHTTLGAAMASARAGDTIIIVAGSTTLSESVVLKAGVDIVGMTGDGNTGNVIIRGNLAFSAAGTVTISNIQLETNSGFFLTVSGTLASIVNLQGCYLNCLNNTGISFTATNTSAQIVMNDCSGNLATTGIAYHSSSSTGNIAYEYCQFSNTGGSTTVTSNSAGISDYFYCNFSSPIGTTSTGGIGILFSNIDSSSQNTIALTANGTGSSVSRYSSFASGSASAITIGTGASLNIVQSNIGSSNTSAITGIGTIGSQLISFTGSSSAISTGLTQNSQTPLPGYVGPATTAVGMLGERIASTATVTTASTTTANVTSISLTAGIWDVSMALIVQASTAATVLQGAISSSTGSFAGSVLGDSQLYSQGNATFLSLSIPAVRVVLSATTLYYLVAAATYTVTASTIGRISAVRVG
jgi:hypothetical protein